MIEGMLTRNDAPVQWVERFAVNGEAGLAAVVLLMAIRDWRWPSKHAERMVRYRGFNSLREDVLEFWYSPWGMNLRERVGLEALDIAQIPM